MENIYQAPAAPLLESAQEGDFFVTSIRKMVIMYIATMGVYSLYWFYKQWSSQRTSMQENIWPFVRAFFSIFFVHALARRMRERQNAKQQGELRYDDVATWFVVLTVVTTIITFGSDYLEVPLLLTIAADLSGFLCLVPLIGLQRNANLASGEPSGESNNGISAANVLCMVLGLLLWAAVIWGYLQVA